eukprot:g36135.t1
MDAVQNADWNAGKSIRIEAVRFTHHLVLRPIDPTEIKPLVFSVFQHRCISPVVHRCVRLLPLFHSISRRHISRAIGRSPAPSIPTVMLSYNLSWTRLVLFPSTG